MIVFDKRIVDLQDYLVSRKKQEPFSTAIGIMELLHECSPKHSCMETARMKQDKERTQPTPIIHPLEPGGMKSRAQ